VHKFYPILIGIEQYMANSYYMYLCFNVVYVSI